MMYQVTMKVFFISLVLLIYGNPVSFSQFNYQDIADTICNELEGTDLTQDKYSLQHRLVTTSNNMYSKYPDIIAQLQEDIKKENPGISDTEMAVAGSDKITMYLLENCTVFLKISQISAQTRYYPDKKCLHLIGDDLCILLKQNRGKTYEELYQIIKENLFSLVKKYEKQVDIDYEGGIENPDFSDDLNAYLLKNCNLYYLTSYVLHG